MCYREVRISNVQQLGPQPNGGVQPGSGFIGVVQRQGWNTWQKLQKAGSFALDVRKMFY
jgi:hypothetical protein